jgi:hypothetical protein
MPLPSSVPREELHLRRYELRGYRRDDGLYDIESRMTDTKSQPLTLQSGRVVDTGEPIHDMWIRVVIDGELNVVDVVAATDSSPFDICHEATATLQSIKGMRIAAGWTMAVKGRLAGKKGCTHLTEMLLPLATVAFQTLAPVRLAKPAAVDFTGRPLKINTCYAYASDREVVRERWPEFYDGPAESTSAS